MIFWLDDFPMPPTVNRYLMPARGRGGMVKTQEARAYERDFKQYLFNCSKQLKPIALACQAAVDRGLQLRVDCYFIFPESKLFSKAGKPKVIDANNRLKPVIDALSACIGVDDCHFFANHCEKISTLDQSQKVFVRIETMRARGIGEVFSLIRQDQMTQTKINERIDA